MTSETADSESRDPGDRLLKGYRSTQCNERILESPASEALFFTITRPVVEQLCRSSVGSTATLIRRLDAFSFVESGVSLLDLHQLRVDLPHTRQRSFEWLGPWHALHGTDIAPTRNGID
jgi:hypothetical protein